MNKKKGITIGEAMKLNEWSIVSIDNLPDGVPVFAVTEFGSKNLAKFHLVEKVLVPTSVLKSKP